jgi:uncharacterized protein YigE (DUF2233 family)
MNPYLPFHLLSCRRPVRGLSMLMLGLSLLCCAGCSQASAESLHWQPLASGLDVTVWDPGTSCGEDVPQSIMVRIDPERHRFSIHHYRDEGLGEPLMIHQWRERTNAIVLFNAGLFREDYSYIGLLLKNGRSVGSRRHPQWQGLFVAEPVASGIRKARVMDLAVESFTEERPVYREAAQSLMLLGQGGEPRVRRSGKRAHQMVVGEDQDGRIVLIRPGEAVPLWELARCIRERLPTLVRAMAMDGGSSSDLLLGPRLLAQFSNGQEVSRLAALVDGTGTNHIPLPSVIGVVPR